MNIKTRTIVVSAAAALAVGTGAAYATSGDPAPDPAAPPAKPATAVQTAAIPAQLTNSFAVLRQVATPGKNATADDVSYGVSRQLIRTVTTDALGAVRIIPGSSGVCLEIDDPVDGSGGSCQSTAGAKAGALTVSLRDESGNGRAIVGLVPDGVSSVTVDGQTVEVSNNVWSTTTSGGEHTASYTDASGSRPIRIP